MAQPNPDEVAAYVQGALDRGAPPDAVAAYLFGSCLDGDMRLDSDIDIGIIAERSAWSREDWVPWHLEAQVATVLKGLRGHEFHVTVLSPRQVRFSFRVVAEGRRVWARDPDAADDFVEFIARRYPDEEYRYRRIEADLIDALRHD
jgi:predicted nucleotidyltransferase